MRDELDIEVRADGARVVIAVSGDLDLATVETLRSCLESVDGNVGEISLDLADLTFLDSTGVALMVGAHRALESDGRSLTLCNPRAQVAKVIELSGVTAAIPVVTDTDPPPLP
jgi:anti-anti-sigma factor